MTSRSFPFQSPSQAGFADPVVHTPRQLGYRMPAEWELHESTWVSWPHNEDTWPDELDRVEGVFAEVVRLLARSETVRINVNAADVERRVRSFLDDRGVRGDVRFHQIPTNDAWVRDYGPVFVTGPGGRLAATTWGFNSWGEKYPPYDLDDAAADKMAGALGVPVFSGGMILEGGSVEVNGCGALITTESCLLNPNRNPDLDRSDVECRLRDFFGVADVVWLRGGIAGDDTDGHVDVVTRFSGPRTIVTVVDDDPQREHFDVLRENLDRLRQFRSADGVAYEIVELPLPAPLRVKGETMPASYANFYVGNAVVLVPIFGDARDDEALSILKRLFPDREVIGLDCRSLIWGLGAFHCLTQQVPRPA